MRLLIHDYSGHPFQVELSRELARRGHVVTHSYCEAYVSGKGHLAPTPGESLTFSPIGKGVRLPKMRFGRRLMLELRFAAELLAQVRRARPDAVLIGNAPVPMLVFVAAGLRLLGIPWVLWHQDVVCVALRSFAGVQLSRSFKLVATAIELGERWASRRAAYIVVIADSFTHVHRSWGTVHKVTVIPNWAPLDEIVPLDRKNDWAVEHGLDECKTLLYSGTLGLKHNPTLLVGLAERIMALGQPVRLVVVNEGPAVELLRSTANEKGVAITLLPFQPYARLPEVLASGDILLVLLERTAGAFSVPSKTLSYLSAGRPIVGLMPEENSAAGLIASVGGCVLPPCADSLGAAARWALNVLRNQAVADELGARSRRLAEREFDLQSCASGFERILTRAGESSDAGRPVHHARQGSSR